MVELNFCEKCEQNISDDKVLCDECYSNEKGFEELAGKLGDWIDRSERK